MRYLIIILLVLSSCRSAKVDKAVVNTSQEVVTTENKDVQTIKTEKIEDNVVQVEIVPVVEDKPIEIKDGNGKVTTIKNGKVKYVVSNKKVEKDVITTDKSKTVQVDTKKTSIKAKKSERKVPVHYHFIFWFIILIILFIIYIQRNFKIFKLW
jgi:uncharacterized protein YcfL